jgi:hypothetical protein
MHVPPAEWGPCLVQNAARSSELQHKAEELEADRKEFVAEFEKKLIDLQEVRQFTCFKPMPRSTRSAPLELCVRILQAFARLNDTKRELAQRQERLELAEEAFAWEKVRYAYSV